MELERDLRRKEKALAETAALLVLSKKFNGTHRVRASYATSPAERGRPGTMIPKGDTTVPGASRKAQGATAMTTLLHRRPLEHAH